MTVHQSPQNFSLRNIKSIAAAALLSLSLISLSGCSKSEEVAPAALEVAVAKVVKKDIPQSYEFVGQTSGAIDAPVRARVEGEILAIHFEEGKEVQQGQLLYEIDPAPMQAKLAEANAKLSEVEVRLAKADSDLKRARPLAKMNAISQKDLDAAIANEGAARGALEAAKAVVEAANIDLSYTKITAPISGLIGISKAKVGEFVGKPPNPVVLNTVSQLDPIHVQLSVTEKEYLFFARKHQDQLNAGEEPKKRILHLFFADGSEHVATGGTVSLDRNIDPKTGTIAIEAAFPNTAKLVRPGQFARIKTEGDIIKGALVIPKKAIRELQGQFQIFVVKSDNSLEARTIQVGPEIDQDRVVESGLTEGEEIATEGIQRLKSGMKITPKRTGV